MPEWSDNTSYSKGERGKVEPQTWTIQTPGGLDLIVTRRIHLEGEWYMMSRALSVDRFLVRDVSAEVAQNRALEELREAVLWARRECHHLGLDTEMDRPTR